MAKKPGISRQKDGTFTINTNIMVDGKVVRIFKRGFKYQQDAALEKESLIRSAKQKSASKVLENFGNLNDAYLDFKKNAVKRSTLYRIKLLISNYFSKYCDLKVSEVVQSNVLAEFITNLKEQNLSVAYCNKIIKVFKDIINLGFRIGLLTQSELNNSEMILLPLRNDSLMNADVGKKQILSKIEFQTFLDVIPKQTRDYVMFLLWGQTGLRIGELRGLQKKHFNPINQTITIIQQANSKMGTGKTEITSTKTQKSNRTISISQNLTELISYFCKSLNYQDSNFLFTAQNRDYPLSEQSIRFALKKYCTLAKVPYIGPHGIRHSNTTWLLSSIKSLDEIGAVSERLGHSSKKVTLDIYFHITKNSDRSLSELVDFY